jgi:type I restriction enzyme, S subunit
MSTALKPYPQYRQSGIDWLPTVPIHWEIVRSKRMFREVDDRGSDGTEPHLAMSQKFGLIPSADLASRHLRSASYRGAKLCLPDDIVLNRLKAHLGVFARANQRGVVSPDYTVLRSAAEVQPRYFEYVYRSTAIRGELRKAVKGIVEGFWRLYSADLGRIMVPVPPFEERKKIADFLDVHTGLVDRLIAAKRRTIAALTERKQAILTELLRGGTDGVATVAGDLPWIDKRPTDWQVNRLKPFVANMTTLATASEPSGGVITLDRVESWSGRVLDRHSAGGDVFAGKIFERDDVLFGKLRPYLAKVTRAMCAGLAGTEFLVLRARQDIFRPKFFELLLRSRPFIDYVASHSVGAKMPRTEWEAIAAIPVAIPSLTQQDGLCEHFAAASDDLDHAIARERDQIDLILEFRNVLISAVVTGQLDVRDVAIPVVEEIEGLDDAATEDDDLEEALIAVD